MVRLFGQSTPEPAAPAAEVKAPATSPGFGTFKGVFTPSLLTILGVIMYLRLGWVLGNLGLALTVVVVLLATAVTFITGLSIAATATSMKVGGGGAYYMVSRSLGLEVGAAVGVPLFFAQALGISFYVAGFAEALHLVLPQVPVAIVGPVTLVLIAVLALLSADLALKAQYVIMAAILLSLVSFFAGGPPDAGFLKVAEVPPRAAFWVVFAVFFPAVTGIEAGIAMSGDLKNPGRSLPLGTIAAVLVGLGVYLAIPIVLSRWVPPEVLLTNALVMREVAWLGPAILVGVWGASLSSALGSMLGAPRTLQALAKDRVMPRFLGRGTGPSEEPRLATGVAFAVALAGLLAGDLNVIAPVLSMFFLASYAVLNASAGLEGLLGSPSWRPTFKTPWWLSLAGAGLCVGVMLMIDAGATIIALLVCGLVFYLVSRRRLRAYWGDMRHGILTMLARFAIYRLAEVAPAARSWRPNILVLSGAPTSRWYLIALADALTHGSGFLTVASVVPAGSAPAGRVGEVEKAIWAHLRERGVPALVEVHVADDVLAGARALVQSSGVGPLQPNTVLLGESENSENLLGFSKLIVLARSLKRNLVMVREADAPVQPGPDKKIVLWWSQHASNAGLMMALAYLLKTSPEWEGAALTLKTVVDDAADQARALARLNGLIARGRFPATAEALVRGEREVFEVMRAESKGASLVFAGIRPPAPDEPPEVYAGYYQQLLQRTDGFPPTALVMAAEDIDFQRIFE